MTRAIDQTFVAQTYSVENEFEISIGLINVISHDPFARKQNAV